MADWVLQIEAPAKEEKTGQQSGEIENGWQHQDEAALVNKQTQGQPEVPEEEQMMWEQPEKERMMWERPEKEQMLWEQHAMGQQLAEVAERGNL
jgi:hypothetical protein